MRELQDKRRLKRLIYSKASVFVLLAAIIFFAHGTWELFEKEQESAANAQAAENQLKKLQERQTLLTSEIERLKTDNGIETEIRSKYSVSKPGESLIVIVDRSTTSPASAQEKEGWWDKFKKIFE